MNSNSTHVCRLCLESSDCQLLSILEKFQDSTIASILSKHFWFQENDKNDRLPEWVCEICWIQTKTFHNFYKRLEFRHKNYSNSIALVNVDEIKRERSVSITEEVLEADLSLVKCIDETDALENVGIQTIKGTESCDEDKDDIIGDQSETEQSSDDEDQCFNDKSRNEDATTNRAQTLHIEQHTESEVDEQDAQIRKFFRMKCEICSGVELESLKKARKHYRQVHKTKGYLMCCEIKFKYRYRMLDHIRFHVNPEAHRCEQCGKSFRNRQILKSHAKIHLQLNFKCELCSKICTSSKLLKYHVQHRHPTDTSEKFPCDQCDRICLSKTLLASHMRNVHDPSPDNVCEICGRTFKHNISLQNHKKIEHSTTPPVKAQCDICGTWVKHERYLPAHLKLHQEMQDAQDGNAEAVNCPICKKKVQYKRLLAGHIRSAHGERKHQCTFCDKAFRTPKSLKEHTALHTGVDLYSCPYCDRTFKSNANMYSHRKKAHVAEWTRDRVNTTTEETKVDREEVKDPDE